MYSNLLLWCAITEYKLFIFIYYRSQFQNKHCLNQVSQIPFSSKADYCVDQPRRPEFMWTLGSHHHRSRLCTAVAQQPESLHAWKVSNESLSTCCRLGIGVLRLPMPAPAVTILNRQMLCVFLIRCSCCSCWISFQPSLHTQQPPAGPQCVTYHHSLLCWVRVALMLCIDLLHVHVFFPRW